MVAPLTWDMLAPKKVKFRKMQKGRMRGKAYRGGRITIGEYGLKALEPGRLTSRQIEAARIAITRHVKRGGRCGHASSRINPSPRNRPRLEWERGKETRSSGWRWSSPDASSTRWMASRARSRSRPYGLPPTSCRLRRSLWLAEGSRPCTSLAEREPDDGDEGAQRDGRGRVDGERTATDARSLQPAISACDRSDRKPNADPSDEARPGAGQ